jgi:hypothetical protein
MPDANAQPVVHLDWAETGYPQQPAPAPTPAEPTQEQK